MPKVIIKSGTPDLRSAQSFTAAKGMDLGVSLEVPNGLTEKVALNFVKAKLEKAVAAVPELSFHVVIGVPDL